MFHKGLIFSIIFIGHCSFADWICTEAASIRNGSTIMSCGVGTAIDEAEARLLALRNAKVEFNEICAQSSDCMGFKVNVVPLRNECMKIKSGEWKCYRGLHHEITTERLAQIESPALVENVKTEVTEQKQEGEAVIPKPSPPSLSEIYKELREVHLRIQGKIREVRSKIAAVPGNTVTKETRDFIENSTDVSAIKSIGSIFKKGDTTNALVNQDIINKLKVSARESLRKQNRQKFGNDDKELLLLLLNLWLDVHSSVSPEECFDLESKKFLSSKKACSFIIDRCKKAAPCIGMGRQGPYLNRLNADLDETREYGLVEKDDFRQFCEYHSPPVTKPDLLQEEEFLFCQMAGALGHEYDARFADLTKIDWENSSTVDLAIKESKDKGLGPLAEACFEAPVPTADILSKMNNSSVESIRKLKEIWLAKQADCWIALNRSCSNARVVMEKVVLSYCTIAGKVRKVAAEDVENDLHSFSKADSLEHSTLLDTINFCQAAYSNQQRWKQTEIAGCKYGLK